MKTKPFKLMTAVVMGAMLLTAFQCGKEEDPEVMNPNYNAHHSKCLSHTDKEAKGFYSPDSASVVYDAANQRLHVNIPIVEAMYAILYEHKSPTLIIQELTTHLQ